MAINSKLSVASGSIIVGTHSNAGDRLMEIRNRGVGEWFFETLREDVITFLSC